uniref:Intraflagellar transport protein 22 homolog n=1 Tax=Plectus sambesii TaxID=2011161 RepID=A0A914UPD6_9BILA
MTEAPFKTKILILGPIQSGKTTIANYLADATEMTGGDYRPTQGVRIVEFESNDLELHGKSIDAEVELWDCSGDKKFEKCWPAIQKDTHGVILVCNPESQEHSKELEQWYTAFVTRRGIRQSHVIVFVHQKPESLGGSNNEALADFRLPSTMTGIQCVPSNIEEDGENLRLEFNNFLCSVIAGLTSHAGGTDR